MKRSAFLKRVVLCILACAVGGSCQSPALPEVQRLTYNGGKRTLDLTIFADRPALSHAWRNGKATAVATADGWVTIQIQAASGLGPVAYRWRWHAVNGMAANDPTAGSWRRMEQDGGHSALVSGTSTIPYPAQAVLQLRQDP